MARSTRQLIFVLGDQLDLDSAAFDGADPEKDVVLMAEAAAEAERHPNHRQRLVLFFSAMRHFRSELRERGFEVRYQQLDDSDAAPDLATALERAVEDLSPDSVVLVEPGRWELREQLRDVAERCGVELDIREDRHFLTSREQFEAWAQGRKRLTMEYFYREVRKRTGYLMNDGEPEGGEWNYDKQNRDSFDSEGPGEIKEPIRFRPDAITREILDLVEERFGGDGFYGTSEPFHWPVTREEAQRAVRDFVENRLPGFGDYQDAMWTDRAFLYHSRIAAALNVKLIDPRYVVERVLDAYESGDAPLNAAEGFIRQVIGWREFIRGVYWLHMPGLGDENSLDARRDLPSLFWSGETGMVCLRQTVTQLLDTAYAHHIQRLMVTGLFNLLYGTHPRQVHDWYMALYADSVEWVTLPNVAGMSQYADGGIVATKPYVATGKYIQRMSNYCDSCRYDPAKATGDDACPFTTLYWDFLMRHEEALGENHRMGFQMKNLERKSDDEREAIAAHARTVRRRVREGAA